MGVPEAKLVADEGGLVPEGEGWFVVNARDTRWFESAELGAYCRFEGAERFPEFGVNLNVLQPGQPTCMYHGESAQEAFLVLSGECVLIIEGQERPLRAWDFVHCPAWTEHVIVGAGDGPCLFLAMGARPVEGVRYPVVEAALRHGAGVEVETTEPAVAYARFGGLEPRGCPEGVFPQGDRREPGSDPGSSV